MTKLISSDSIIASVKDFLKSFDNLDLIEDSDLFSWISWVNNRLGIGVSVEKELIAKVDNFKVPIPEYFNVLWAIHSCNLCEGIPKQHQLEFNHSITYEKRNMYPDGSCDIKVEKDPTIVTEKWSLRHNQEKNQTKYCNRKPLTIAPNIPKSRIHTECFNYNIKTQDEFNLDSNFFYFNFTDSYVHVQYYAHPFDDEGYPLVANDEYVLKAIEDYLIFKSLQKLFINGSVDVQTRLQYYQGESAMSLKEALFNQKLDSFNSLISAAKRRPQYLEVYNLRSSADGRINKS